MKRVIAVLAVAACGTLPPAAGPRPGLDVRIVSHLELVKRTARRAPIELPFGQSQNGTELVTALLQRARDAGAVYVGDLAFHMVFKWRGSFVECETKVTFGDAPSVAPLPPATPVAAATGSDDDMYSTEVQSFEPHEVSFIAHERDLACKQVGVAGVEVLPRQYDSQFDVQVAHPTDESIVTAMPRPPDSEVTSEQVEQCSPQRVNHRVERYDYEVTLDYVPPDWTYFGATYAGTRLSESPPLCYALDARSLAAHPVHRLTATLGFRGAIDQVEPTLLPSR